VTTFVIPVPEPWPIGITDATHPHCGSVASIGQPTPISARRMLRALVMRAFVGRIKVVVFERVHAGRVQPWLSPLKQRRSVVR
jgi:hypothetical protein